jgi:hypothetical protein
MQDFRDGLDEQRLREAGNTGQQAMTAGKEGDEHLIDDFVLPDDHLAEFLQDAFSPFLDFGG